MAGPAWRIATTPCPTCGTNGFSKSSPRQVYCSVVCGRRSAKYVGKLCFTDAEDGVLRERFPHESSAAVSRAMGRTVASVSQRARALGLTKSAEYLASPAACRLRRGDEVGKAHRFQKGQVAHNKGLRRPGWSVGRGRMQETQFKKGQVGNRTMPVGATRLIEGYLYRKVSAVRFVPHTVNWKLEHVLVWERANGPLPAGHAVAFKNGDKTDIRLENLECISRTDLMRRNSIHRLPPALKATVRVLASVNRQIRKRTNDAAEKQNH